MSQMYESKEHPYSIKRKKICFNNHQEILQKNSARLNIHVAGIKFSISSAALIPGLNNN